MNDDSSYITGSMNELLKTAATDNLVAIYRDTTIRLV